MTTVYGVTFVGAREQIERRLTERGDVAPEDAWLAAAYLAKKVSVSLTVSWLVADRNVST